MVRSLCCALCLFVGLNWTRWRSARAYCSSTTRKVDRGIKLFNGGGKVSNLALYLQLPSCVGVGGLCARTVL